eukprot:4124953-Prymnesium_polylepis.2
MNVRTAVSCGYVDARRLGERTAFTLAGGGRCACSAPTVRMKEWTLCAHSASTFGADSSGTREPSLSQAGSRRGLFAVWSPRIVGAIGAHAARAQRGERVRNHQRRGLA